MLARPAGRIGQRMNPHRHDAAFCAEIRRVHAASFGTHGLRKIWHQLGRQGMPVIRRTLARLVPQKTLL